MYHSQITTVGEQSTYDLVESHTHVRLTRPRSLISGRILPQIHIYPPTSITTSGSRLIPLDTAPLELCEHSNTLLLLLVVALQEMECALHVTSMVLCDESHTPLLHMPIPNVALVPNCVHQFRLSTTPLYRIYMVI